MKGIAPSLLCGALAGIALFGVLWAIEPERIVDVDSWKAGWEEAGLDVQFRSVTRGSESSLLLRRLRRRLEEPECEGTRARRYDVNLIRTEIVELPREGLLEELPEGRHPKFQYEEDRRRANYSRQGRFIALVAVDVRTFGARFPSNPEMVDRILDAFEEMAARLEPR